jgi:hypothetical protein
MVMLVPHFRLAFAVLGLVLKIMKQGFHYMELVKDNETWISLLGALPRLCAILNPIADPSHLVLAVG